MAAAAVGLGAPSAGSADTFRITTLAPVAGVCAAGSELGALSLTVSSAVLGPPVATSVAVSGSATCLSSNGMSTMTISLQGTIPFSCIAGTTYATSNILTG